MSILSSAYTFVLCRRHNALKIDHSGHNSYVKYLIWCIVQ